MAALSFRTQLGQIGEKLPFSYPADCQTAPASLRQALESMNNPRLDTWQFLNKREFANTGWSVEFQGLTHDQQFWYFVNKKALLKFNRQFQKIAEVEIPANLKQQGFDHFGDSDFFQGHIYVPLEHSNYTDPAIVVFDTTLKLVRTGILRQSGQRHAPWCAIHPWDGRIYTSEDDNVSDLFVYDPQTFAYLGRFKLRDANGVVEKLDSVQGGCFSRSGRLYLTSGNTDDIRCYNMLNGHFMGRKPIYYSKGSTEYEEMEGITIWNLNSEQSGDVHLAILDNDWPSEDDLFLHHYAINTPA